jgi:hypothetical protein
MKRHCVIDQEDVPVSEKIKRRLFFYRPDDERMSDEDLYDIIASQGPHAYSAEVVAAMKKIHRLTKHCYGLPTSTPKRKQKKSTKGPAPKRRRKSKPIISSDSDTDEEEEPQEEESASSDDDIIEVRSVSPPHEDSLAKTSPPREKSPAKTPLPHEDLPAKTPPPQESEFPHEDTDDELPPTPYTMPQPQTPPPTLPKLCDYSESEEEEEPAKMPASPVYAPGKQIAQCQEPREEEQVPEEEEPREEEQRAEEEPREEDRLDIIIGFDDLVRTRPLCILRV